MQKIVTIPSEFSEIRGGLAAADGGTPLTTTATCIDIPFGADWMSLTARNFAGCASVKFAINPYLTIIATTDLLVTPSASAAAISSSATTDISAEMQDGDTTDFAIDDFPTAANGGYIYVGAPIPFRGVLVTVGSTSNSAARTLTVSYWGSGWTDTSNGDNTKSTGSLEADGTVEWTPSATWTRDSLVSIGATTLKESWAIADLYWTRWEWDGALDSSSDIAKMQCINRCSTNYAQLIEGQSIEQRIHTKASKISVGNVEALTNAGTANLIVNAASTSFGGASEREIFE